MESWKILDCKLCEEWRVRAVKDWAFNKPFIVLLLNYHRQPFIKGSKHCVLPEAVELIVDEDEHGEYVFERLAGQTAVNGLRNLGYKPG